MYDCDTFREHIADAQRILLTGPVRPDADSIGACLALREVLMRWGKDAIVAGDIAFRYQNLPGAADIVRDEDVRGPFDAVVVIDGDRHRLTPPIENLFERTSHRFVIDHHATTEADGYLFAWIAPNETSTCTMIQKALARWREPLDATLAALLYAGTVYDTGGFRYQNTTAETHRLAADLLACEIDHVTIAAQTLVERRIGGLRLLAATLSCSKPLVNDMLMMSKLSAKTLQEHGADISDCDGIVDVLLHVVGVEVAALIIEVEHEQCKISLRGRGMLDLAQVAKSLTPTGGGHRNASGARLACDPSEAESRIVSALTPLLVSTTIPS